MQGVPRGGMIPPPGGFKGKSPGDISAMLMDEERVAHMKEMQAKKKRVSMFTLAVEKILLDGEATWDEWGGVIETMNARSQVVIPRITIKEMNERYESISGTKTSSDANPREGVDGGGKESPSGGKSEGDGGGA